MSLVKKNSAHIIVQLLSIILNFWDFILSFFHNFKYIPPTETPDNKWDEERLNQFRQQGDDIAQECYDRLKAENGDHFAASYDMITEIKKRANLEGEENAIFKKFYEQTHQVPAWVNFEQIERGTETIKRSTLPAGVLVLTAGSLVQSYAGAKGAEVLVETGRYIK